MIFDPSNEKLIGFRFLSRNLLEAAQQDFMEMGLNENEQEFNYDKFLIFLRGICLPYNQLTNWAKETHKMKLKVMQNIRLMF